MEQKINALMIKSVDYKDNDKMLTLYSLEKGKIGAGIKGVKKAGAKLTFCAMPFCFAEYILSVKGDRYSVVGASEIESFYKIRLNVSSYYFAGAVCEFLIKFTEDGEVNEPLFYLAVNTLKSLCFEDFNPESAIVAFINFWSEALGLIGYAADFFRCGVCGKTETAKKIVADDSLQNAAEKNSESLRVNGEETVGRAFFDFSAGACVCENCCLAGKKNGVSEIMPSTLNAVRYALIKSRGDSDEDFLTDDDNAAGSKNTKSANLFCVPEKGDFVRALKFLNHYTALKLGDGLKTVTDYIKIIYYIKII